MEAPDGQAAARRDSALGGAVLAADELEQRALDKVGRGRMVYEARWKAVRWGKVEMGRIGWDGGWMGCGTGCIVVKRGRG